MPEKIHKFNEMSAQISKKKLTVFDHSKIDKLLESVWTESVAKHIEFN
jgi:hypothetical protein